MKQRIPRLFVLLLLSTAWLPAGAPAGPQPVYVYLYARVTDHVHLDLSEERLRRVLPEIERFRKEHPEAHVSATILFSGAISQALADRDSQTHIVDYVKDFIQRGIIEPGYNGTDEPTYRSRPTSALAKASAAGDRWLTRVNTADRLFTEARDPLTGTDLPGHTGGLEKMQEVFGKPTSITGVELSVPDAAWGVMPEFGPDTETVHELRKFDSKAIMFGISDSDPLHSPRFRFWSASFSKSMSPVPETSPELYWQDNVLRSSESSGPQVRLFRALDGPEGFQKVLAKLDRSQVRILHVELASPRSYVTQAFAQFLPNPPLAYAYLHPDQPQIPAEARRPAAEIDAAYAKEAALLDWMTREFFPANSGSRFVTGTTLQEMAGPSAGYSISVDRLKSALSDALRDWEKDPQPPKYLFVDGHYLSLADMFQSMTDALAEFSRAGKLPSSVRVARVYGPAETSFDMGSDGPEVTVASVARAAAELTVALHDDSWSPLPKNLIPFHVTVDGNTMNAAQFLRLMAESLVSGNPEAKIQVKRTSMFWGKDATYYRARSIADEGVSWTFKPALLQQSAN